MSSRVVRDPITDIRSRVVLHWINQCIQFLRVRERTLIVCASAGGIYTVSEYHDCLASGDATQLLVYHHVDGIVQSCAIAGMRALNGSLKFCAISCHVGENLYVVVERNDHHFIVRAQLIDESDGG